MSEIRSFSVGNGDMYYIRHNSDNFTIIDCSMPPRMREDILEQVKLAKYGKTIVRFISTHPDEDHILGLEYLDDEIGIVNFYCVKNNATKDLDTTAFKRYRELHDSSKAFYLSKDCTRKWMNLKDGERGSSGISVLWPDINNEHFKKELECVKNGYLPNNISTILKYQMDKNTFLWFGDIDGDFLEKVIDNISLPKRV